MEQYLFRRPVSHARLRPLVLSTRTMGTDGLMQELPIGRICIEARERYHRVLWLRLWRISRSITSRGGGTETMPESNSFVSFPSQATGPLRRFLRNRRR